MKLFPYFGEGGVSRPLGLEMSQNRLAVPTWSYAMEIAPPARIVEIGHAGGGFTTALALHAHLIGAEVWSFDLCAVNQRYAPIAHQFGVHFVQIDVWGQAAQEHLERLIARPGPTFVLCDGGDKHRELALFAPFCKPGDVLAAHDYDAMHERDPSSDQLARPWPWCETRKAVGDEVAQKHNLEPWLQEHFDLAGWLAYRKRDVSQTRAREVSRPEGA